MKKWSSAAAAAALARATVIALSLLATAVWGNVHAAIPGETHLRPRHETIVAPPGGARMMRNEIHMCFRRIGRKGLSGGTCAWPLGGVAAGACDRRLLCSEGHSPPCWKECGFMWQRHPHAGVSQHVHIGEILNIFWQVWAAQYGPGCGFR